MGRLDPKIRRELYARASKSAGFTFPEWASLLRDLHPALTAFEAHDLYEQGLTVSHAANQGK